MTAMVNRADGYAGAAGNCESHDKGNGEFVHADKNGAAVLANSMGRQLNLRAYNRPSSRSARTTQGRR
jgi:hypothetical protein